MIFDPEIWGPHYWFFLHTVSESYPLTPNETTKKKYYDNLCDSKRIKTLNFSNKKTVINKEINDDRIFTELNYNFKHAKI